MRHVASATLCNEHLEATFLLGLGGRLWSLRDAEHRFDAVQRSDPVHVGNLALRNAWFAGGVEWNLGATGHWGLTAEPVFAGVVDSGQGFPVLRMWAFERLRRLVWRLDAWLPPGARSLFVRVVLDNPGSDPASVYWWSNIAVPAVPGLRVVAPARTAAHFGGRATLHTVDVPHAPTGDVSRPLTLGEAGDYFFDIPSGQRPWIAAVGPCGRGLAHASTDALRGRKVFVWGDSTGGRRWQEWLGCSYVEIQAGLARTQLEHVALPAGERLAWTEAYVPLHGLPADAGWEPLRAGVEAFLDREPGASLAEWHARAQAWESSPPEIHHEGDGWGALAVRSGDTPDDPSVPVPASTLGPQQQPWLVLLETGALPVSDPPAPSVTGRRWAALLEAASQDWHVLLHRARVALAAGDRAAADALLAASVESDATAWAWSDRAELARLDGAVAEWVEASRQAWALRPGDLWLAVGALAALLQSGRASEALDLVAALDPALREHPRIRYAECAAAAATGDVERARELLALGVVFADLREGEASLDTLWAQVSQTAGSDDPLPPELDFRMHVGRDVVGGSLEQEL